MSFFFIFTLISQFICTINDNALRKLNTNDGTWLKVCLWIGSSLALNSLISCYFFKKIEKYFKTYKPTSARNIFFDSFCIIGVLTHFVVEKDFSYYTFGFSVNIIFEI